MSARAMKHTSPGSTRAGAWIRSTATLVSLAAATTLSASASPQPPVGALPVALALEAATETLRVCEARGLRVAVAVVDPDGVIKVQARGDGSPIHSQDFSWRKAYTVMSMGPMQGVDTSGALVGKVAAAATEGTSKLLMLPGAVLVKQNGQAIGAIGVSGAPRSLDDESCAQAGAEKIRASLQASATGQ